MRWLKKSLSKYGAHPWNQWIADRPWFAAHYGMDARGRGNLSLRLGAYRADFFVGSTRDQASYPTERPPWLRVTRAIEARPPVLLMASLRLPCRSWSPRTPCPRTVYAKPIYVLAPPRAVTRT